MSSLARRFPFSIYYLLAYAIATAVMAIYVGGVAPDPMPLMLYQYRWLGEHNLHVNAINIVRFAAGTGSWIVLLVFVYASAPTVAAFVTTAAAGGASALRRWCARLKPIGPDGVPLSQAVSAYAVMFGVHLAVVAWYFWFTWAHGSPGAFDKLWSIMGGSLPLVIALSLVSTLLDEGGLFEEMGWRGFALPLLQARMSPLAAAVVLGLAWWGWHIPRDLPGLLGGGAGAWLSAQAVFGLGCVSSAIVIAYFVNRTGGSVLPAMIVHGGTNVWSKALGAGPYAVLHVDVRTWITVALCVAVLLAAGRNLGRRVSTPPAEAA